MDDSTMLLDLYGEFSRIKHDIDEEHCQKITSSHPDFENQVHQRVLDLHRGDEAVIIAGETSAGKSSLMNILLGYNLCSVHNLPATNKIYRVHKSDDIRLVCRGKDGEVIKESNHDNQKSLKTTLRKTEDELHPDLLVDIYFPTSEIKENVVLVDTPGIGNSQEHTETLMSYIPNAVAFVFVVNVRNSGGFQHARLLDVFKHIRDKLPEMPCFNPVDVLFVMNKWDCIDEHERDEVMQHAKQSLYEAWPYVSMAPENTFCVSLKQIKNGEASEFTTTEFNRFKKTLCFLMEKNANKRIKEHSRYLEGLVLDAKWSVLATINRENKRYEIRTFLDVIEAERSNFIEKTNELVTVFNEKAEALAYKCQTYMSSDDSYQNVVKCAAAQRLTLSPEEKLHKSFMKQVEMWCTGEDVRFEVEDIDSKIKDFSKNVNHFLQRSMEQLTGQPVESLIIPFDVTCIFGEFLKVLPKAVSFYVETIPKLSWWFSTKSSREKTMKQQFDTLLKECLVSLIQIFKQIIVLYFSEKINHIIKILVSKCDFVKTMLQKFDGTPKLQEEVLSKLKTIIDDLQNVSVRLAKVQRRDTSF